MTTRSVLIALLAVAAPGFAQQAATPKLSKDQRTTLQAVVAAVDAAAELPDNPDVKWQTHVLRASDGSHYVAFSVLPPAALAPPPKATLYVRLATRSAALAPLLTERSAVMEWLKGMRSDPLVAKKKGGIAFGEMPVFGAGSIAARGPGQQSGDLALLSMERERARERREADERERKATLEGTASRPRHSLFPFEDFAVDTALPPTASGPAVLRRSFTAGPGEYDLYVAWAAPEKGARTVPVRVVKSTLRLPPVFSSELALSSVIVADHVGTRETPYPADQQSSHPYAIGAMEIVPARDEVFTNDERLAVVFQVLNAAANAAGKPDIGIAFQLFRVTPGNEQLVGPLNPQNYNEGTLPADFDLTKGHPLFAAVAAPLKTVGRGDYRLKITVTDRLAKRNAVSDASFKIVPTPTTLLASAPMGTPLQKDSLVEPGVLSEVATLLGSDGMTPALADALDAARAARFVDLLREDPPSPRSAPPGSGVTGPPSPRSDPAGFGEAGAREQGARTTLRGIGLYALGDPRMARTLLGQALQRLSPNPVAHLFLGACRALEGNDREAIAAWQSALDAGLPAALATPLLLDAHLRLGDIARAGELARAAQAGGSAHPAVARALAAVHIAAKQELEAIPLMERRLAEQADDQDARFLWLHAVFASLVNAQGPGTTADGKERFSTHARTYIDAKGRHASLVAEWVEELRTKN